MKARLFWVLLVVAICWLSIGCGSLHRYRWATHGPGDTSAGDLTH